MHVSEIMTREVSTVSPLTTLENAARQMREYDVGALPVIESERLVGIITDRDIVLRAVAEALDGMFARVSDAMTSNVVVCRGDADLEHAVDMMSSKQIRRLPVVDGDERLVGILALGDIALHENSAAGFALGEISEIPVVSVLEQTGADAAVAA